MSTRSAWNARPRSRVAAEAGSRWPVKVFEAYDGRSAFEATVGPDAVKGRNQGPKIPEGRCPSGRQASIGLGTWGCTKPPNTTKMSLEIEHDCSPVSGYRHTRRQVPRFDP